MEIQIHKDNMLVIKIDLTKVAELAKSVNPCEVVAEDETKGQQPKEEQVTQPTPSEEDILGGETSVESKSTAKRVAATKPKAEPKPETKVEPKTKAEPKAKAEPKVKAEPKTKPEPKKSETKETAPIAKLVKYNRLDAKHRDAVAKVIEATLGKDWKTTDSVRNKVGDFSRDAHEKLDFLDGTGKVCPSFTEAFAKFMGI